MTSIFSEQFEPIYMEKGLKAAAKCTTNVCCIRNICFVSSDGDLPNFSYTNHSAFDIDLSYKFIVRKIELSCFELLLKCTFSKPYW